MIFVTVGTYYVPFDRLLTAVAELPLKEELVVQHGPSGVRPRGATCYDFLPFDQQVEHLQRARVVVTHGGVGTVITALTSRKVPVVVPRLRRYGEAVDDHQLTFARRLAERGLVELVQDVGALENAILRSQEREAPTIDSGGRLASELSGYIRATVENRALRG